MLHRIVNRRARGTFFEIFSIDIRTLSSLRIGLAVCSLIYIGGLFQDAELFLSSKGLLPAGMSRELLDANNNGFWSLYWLSDSVAFCQMLLTMHLIAALLLLVGFQTRIATIFCLVLTWSLEVRNPLLQGYGIYLLRMMLVWSAFLPMAGVWSVDSVSKYVDRRDAKTWQVANMATCALMVQSLIGLVLFAASIWIGRYSVVDWFQFEIGLTSIGISFGSHPILMKVVAWLALVGASFAPLTMVMPALNQFFRGIWMALFVLAQIAMLLLFCGAFYPVVALVSWLVFVPGVVWSGWFGEPPGYAEKPTNDPSDSKTMALAIQMGCLGLLILAMVASLIQWKFLNLGAAINQRVANASHLLMISPGWQLAPSFRHPTEKKIVRPWFAYEGKTAEGRSIDLLSLETSRDREKPKIVSGSFANERQRRLHVNLWKNQSETEVLETVSTLLLKRMIRNWNASPLGDNGKLDSAKLICHEEQVVDGEVVEENSDVWAMQ